MTLPEDMLLYDPSSCNQGKGVVTINPCLESCRGVYMSNAADIDNSACQCECRIGPLALMASSSSSSSRTGQPAAAVTVLKGLNK